MRRSLLAGAGSLALLCGFAAPAYAGGAVTPTVECVFDNADGTYTGVFGYTNNSSATVTLAVGGANNFTPAPSDRGQPTVFEPGSHTSVLVVTFSGTDLAWNLNSNTVHATSTSTPCPADPTLSGDFGGLPAVVLLALVTLAMGAVLGRPTTTLGRGI